MINKYGVLISNILELNIRSQLSKVNISSITKFNNEYYLFFDRPAYVKEINNSKMGQLREGHTTIVTISKDLKTLTPKFVNRLDILPKKIDSSCLLSKDYIVISSALDCEDLGYSSISFINNQEQIFPIYHTGENGLNLQKGILEQLKNNKSKDIEFFKVGGVECIENYLYFAIRACGNNHENFNNVTLFVRAEWTFENDKIMLDIDKNYFCELEHTIKDKQPGFSSVKIYDGKVYFTLSEDNVYLCYADIENIKNDKNVKMKNIMNSKGDVLNLMKNAQGVEFVSRNEIIVVYNVNNIDPIKTILLH